MGCMERIIRIKRSTAVVGQEARAVGWAWLLGRSEPSAEKGPTLPDSTTPELSIAFSGPAVTNFRCSLAKINES